jgi:hypothetical protein
VRCGAGDLVQQKRSRRKVSPQVYEPAVEAERLPTEESELTPIFHALARRASDPVEHFRRDPLGAPLPAAAPSTPGKTRMLLQAVPTGLLDTTGVGRPDHGLPTPESPEPATQAALHRGPHQPRASRDGRGGRHRALRSVTSGPGGSSNGA